LAIKALFLNCSLKVATRVSNTQALVDKVAGLMQGLGVAIESVRARDDRVAFGQGLDEGDGDQWALILGKVRASGILVTPRHATPRHATPRHATPRRGTFLRYWLFGGFFPWEL